MVELDDGRYCLPVNFRLDIDGRPSDTEALWHWLRQEPDLQGKVRLASTPTTKGTMGGATEIVVQGVAAVVGATTLWVAVSQSVTTFLTQRRADVTLNVTRQDGFHVSISVERTGDPDKTLSEMCRVLEAYEAGGTGNHEDG